MYFISIRFIVNLLLLRCVFYLNINTFLIKNVTIRASRVIVPHVSHHSYCGVRIGAPRLKKD